MIKTLSVEQINDVKKVSKYLDRFSNDMLDKIIEWANTDKVGYFTFADVNSSVRMILEMGDAVNVDCFLPDVGNHYDMQTLIVRKLFFYVGNKEIDNILRNCSESMLERICFNAQSNVERCAYHRGYHEITLDLHDATSKKCWIVK